MNAILPHKAPDGTLILVDETTNIPAEARNSFAVIGNMDGLHLGHRALVAHAKERATQRGCALSAIVFHPHPRLVFQPDTAPFLLTSLSFKAALLASVGVKYVFALRFAPWLYTQSPAAFVADTLSAKLGVSGVNVGQDFLFGNARLGDARTLCDLAKPYGFDVETVPLLKEAGSQKYASSLARQALRRGEPEKAASILGMPWQLSSVVVRGEQLGRKLHFPTANLHLGELLPPRAGVYAIKAQWRGQNFTGVANFGSRPTVKGTDARLEVHLFDFASQIYGEELIVQLHHFIRAEQHFESIDALQKQISDDCQTARKYFARSSYPQ